MNFIFYFPSDPHVKVEGKRPNVLEAKKKILEVLETRVKPEFIKLFPRNVLSRYYVTNKCNSDNSLCVNQN